MLPDFHDIFKIRSCVPTFPFKLMVRVRKLEIWEHRHAPGDSMLP